jgi:hypothetical protein
MVGRPLVVDVPWPLYHVLEQLADERGVRPAALVLALIRPHLVQPRTHARLRLVPAENAQEAAP